MFFCSQSHVNDNLIMSLIYFQLFLMAWLSALALHAYNAITDPPNLPPIFFYWNGIIPMLLRILPMMDHGSRFWKFWEWKLKRELVLLSKAMQTGRWRQTACTILEKTNAPPLTEYWWIDWKNACNGLKCLLVAYFISLNTN